MQKPPNVRVGLSRAGLGARIIPGSGDVPTVVGLDGDRALARYLAAREMAGNQFDAKLKASINHLDEALLKPWTMGGLDVQRYLLPSGLQITVDEALAARRTEEASRARAKFTRWVNDGEDWQHVAGGIPEARQALVATGLRELGWRRYGGLTPDGDADANEGNSIFTFAWDSLLECGTKRDNLLGWSGGTGKSRAGVALADYYQSTDAPGPIVVVALKRHLRDTWINDQLPKIDLLKDRYGMDVYWEEWLEKEDRPTFTKPFVLISFERMTRLTEDDFAFLESKIRQSVVIVDEVYLLGNFETLRVKRAMGLIGMGGNSSGSQHTISLSGTPFRGNTTASLPVLSFTFRPGSVAFPSYDIRKQNAVSNFEADYVQYAVSDDGTRRRVPLLKNASKFYEMLSPLVSRRLRTEPDVVRVLGAANVISSVVNVDFSPEHKAFYEQVLEQFSEWYRRVLASKGQYKLTEGEILIKLGFVVRAVAQPWAMKAPPTKEEAQQEGQEKWVFPEYPKAMTSVMEWAVKRAQAEVIAGRQVLIGGYHTQQLDLMSEALQDLGISSGVIHGGVNFNERTRILRAFKQGEIAVLPASFGVAAESLNLGEATRAIVVEQHWVPSVIEQFEWRMTRGIVEESPESYRTIIPGSISEYQQQWGLMKNASVAAGLDNRKQTMTGADVLDLRAYCDALARMDNLKYQPRKYTLEMVN